jgi:hypothetical protein
MIGGTRMDNKKASCIEKWLNIINTASHENTPLLTIGSKIANIVIDKSGKINGRQTRRLLNL